MRFSRVFIILLFLPLLFPSVIEVDKQIDDFYNISFIKNATLSQLGWKEIGRKNENGVIIVEGTFSEGIFRGYDDKAILRERERYAFAKLFFPADKNNVANYGIVMVRHTEQGVRGFDEDKLVDFVLSTRIPVLLYGETNETINEWGYGRDMLSHVSLLSLMYLNRGYTDVVTGNFLLFLARAHSRAITLLQRLIENEGKNIVYVGSQGGSKEGYAVWFASTVDDRIKVAHPGGMKLEDPIGMLNETIEQWGCENKEVFGIQGEKEKMRYLSFLEKRKDITKELSISSRINAGKGKSDFYIVAGDVGVSIADEKRVMHDGHHFPLGKSEMNFLNSAPIKWVYFLRKKESAIFDRLWEIAFALSSSSNQDTLLRMRPRISEAKIENGTLIVQIEVQHPIDNVTLFYAESKDKVWNKPGIEWKEKVMECDASRTRCAAKVRVDEGDVAYVIVAKKSIFFFNRHIIFSVSTSIHLIERLPPKTCFFDERCVPGRPCVKDRKSMSIGQILNITFCGIHQPSEGGKYKVAEFFVDFWSRARNGTRVGARVFIPIGTRPSSGWPVKIWSHGYGGPGSDYYHYPFVDEKMCGNTREQAGLSYASYGFVAIDVFQSGAGASEPFMGYSPLSIWYTKWVVLDAIEMVKNLPSELEQRYKKVIEKRNLSLSGNVIDTTRIVLSTNCISSPTLIAVAEEVAGHPEEYKGVKAFVADTFNPSPAYIMHCLTPILMEDKEYTGTKALGYLNIWTSVVWTLAEDNGWDKREFFTDEFIRIYAAPVKTPVGWMSLGRAGIAEPPSASSYAPRMMERLKEKYGIGNDATVDEMAPLLLTEPMQRLMIEGKDNISIILNDPFYRKYFANSDPFFEENTQPFKLDQPLFVVINAQDDEFRGEVLGGSKWHAVCMTLPRIETLKSWGWNISYFMDEDERISTLRGKGLRWTLKNLYHVLYDISSSDDLDSKKFDIPFPKLSKGAVLILFALLFFGSLVYWIRKKQNN